VQNTTGTLDVAAPQRAAEVAATPLRRERGRPADGPQAHFERVVAAHNLFEEVGATKAAQQLGVSRQTIYNLVAEFKRRVRAAEFCELRIQRAVDEREQNWQKRQSVRRRQQRYRERKTTVAHEKGTVKRPVPTGARMTRVPEYLGDMFAHAKAVRSLCPTVMTAMRKDAATRGAAFDGWSDQHVASAVCTLMQWDYAAEFDVIGRALCQHWGVRCNDSGQWLPELDG
jgi:plasmid maintenance system antidote protein VapI